MNQQIIKLLVLVLILVLVFIGNIIGCNQSLIEEEIVFVRTKKYLSFPAEIILRTVNKNTEKKLLAIKDSFVGGFNWSPDGKKLAFHLCDFKESKIYVMDFTNKKHISLTDNSMRRENPCWSPDGKKLAFVGRLSLKDNGDIYVMDAMGKNQKKLTTTFTDDLSYVWTPDGEKIIFMSSPNYDENKKLDANFIKYKGNSDIYIIDSDGKNQTKLIDNPTNDKDISLSPNGKKVAYISLCNDNYEIFVMDIDGKNKVQLTNNSVDDWQPKWSPDGKKIAFISASDCMLYLMDADGKNQIKLTEINGKNKDLITVTSFVWSPDGKKIAFWGSSFNESKDIYLIDINSRKLRNLTNTPDWDEQWISWRPIPKD